MSIKNKIHNKEKEKTVSRIGKIKQELIGKTIEDAIKIVEKYAKIDKCSYYLKEDNFNNIGNCYNKISVTIKNNRIIN